MLIDSSANPQPFTSLAPSSVPFSAAPVLLDELSGEDASDSAPEDSGSGSATPVSDQHDLEETSSSEPDDSDDAGEWNARRAKRIKKVFLFIANSATQWFCCRLRLRMHREQTMVRSSEPPPRRVAMVACDDNLVMCNVR